MRQQIQRQQNNEPAYTKAAEADEAGDTEAADEAVGTEVAEEAVGTEVADTEAAGTEAEKKATIKAEATAEVTAAVTTIIQEAELHGHMTTVAKAVERKFFLVTCRPRSGAG